MFPELSTVAVPFPILFVVGAAAVVGLALWAMSFLNSYHAVEENRRYRELLCVEPLCVDLAIANHVGRALQNVMTRLVPGSSWNTQLFGKGVRAVDGPFSASWQDAAGTEIAKVTVQVVGQKGQRKSELSITIVPVGADAKIFVMPRVLKRVAKDRSDLMASNRSGFWQAIGYLGFAAARHQPQVQLTSGM